MNPIQPNQNVITTTTETTRLNSNNALEELGCAFGCIIGMLYFNEIPLAIGSAVAGGCLGGAFDKGLGIRKIKDISVATVVLDQPSSIEDNSTTATSTGTTGTDTVTTGTVRKRQYNIYLPD